MGFAFGVVGVSEAGWLAAGSILGTAIATGLTDADHDPLYPAHLRLARFRRTERPADVLVAIPLGSARGRRSSARDARGALRITDGAAISPSADGPRLCAVLDQNPATRNAIEHRLRTVCGSQVATGWASFPGDGVTLEALVAAATDRISAGDRVSHPQGVKPGANGLGSRGFGPARNAPIEGRETEIEEGTPAPAHRELGRILVTGCAGFLGSHLSERLLAAGEEVVGVDCFTDYYPRELKLANLERLREERRFTLRELDLGSEDLDDLLEGVDTVFHLAAQPGVRGSFGTSFERYVHDNVLATQRLLEISARAEVGAFVYASSSSVYGDSLTYPTPEDTERAPKSPYGLTKLATEELAGVYGRNEGMNTVGLRYFTAYGPRQRPDMAFAKFLRAALAGVPVRVLGDGHQIRDFTFVDDVVDGTIAAARRRPPGAVYNIGGGTQVRLLDALRKIEGLLGRPIRIDHLPNARGDVRRTCSDPQRAARDLGFVPRVTIDDGLERQAEWTLSQEAGQPAVVPA